MYVAALGHAYGPNAERGVFKTTDGGKTWSKVLFKDENTGAISLAMDPQHPDTVYAALWQTRRPPWNIYPPSNGPGSGALQDDRRRQDLDATHERTSREGRAHRPRGRAERIRRACTRKSTRRPTSRKAASTVPMTAGPRWTHMAGGAAQRRIWQRGWYFSGITVDTKNPDVVYVMDTATYRSDDGGKTFNAIKGSPGGDDYHTLWINPDDPTHMILGSDQGVVVSLDRAKTWSSWYNQPTAQLYHVIADNRFPYWVYGAQQDSGAMAVTESIDSSEHHLHGLAPDGRRRRERLRSRSIPIIPAGSSAAMTRAYEDLATGWEQSIDATTAYPDTVWRHTWTLPIVVSPVDHALYTSRQQIFRSRDGGKAWTIISPDLTGPASEDHPEQSRSRRRSPITAANRAAASCTRSQPSPFDAKTHLGRHRRRPRLDHARRRRALEQHHAAAADRRGAKSASSMPRASTATPRTSRSIGTGSKTIAPTSIRRATAARTGARSQTAFPMARSSTSCAPIRRCAACSTPEPNAACTFRSTTARTGSRCSAIFR